MSEIESLHYPHARTFLAERLPGIAPEALRRRVYEQTEILRKWYAGRMRDEPAPYRDTVEGYVYAYMPRGYRWIDELAVQFEELRKNLEKAKRVAVIGAGPAPELWSLFRRIKEPELFQLFDTRIDDWWPVIEHFRTLTQINLPSLAICGLFGFYAAQRGTGGHDCRQVRGGVAGIG